MISSATRTLLPDLQQSQEIHSICTSNFLVIQAFKHTCMIKQSFCQLDLVSQIHILLKTFHWASAWLFQSHGVEGKHFLESAPPHLALCDYGHQST